MAMAARIPMMATTIINSMSVKPPRFLIRVDLSRVISLVLSLLFDVRWELVQVQCQGPVPVSFEHLRG